MDCDMALFSCFILNTISSLLKTVYALLNYFTIKILNALKEVYNTVYTQHHRYKSLLQNNVLMLRPPFSSKAYNLRV